MARTGAPTSLAVDLDRRIARLTQLLRSESVGSGFSVTALSVLRRVHDEGPHRVTDLAGAEGVAQPTMTSLVGRLETRGLVRRVPDPVDGRAVLVTATDTGAAELARVRTRRAELLDARLTAMD